MKKYIAPEFEVIMLQTESINTEGTISGMGGDYGGGDGGGTGGGGIEVPDPFGEGGTSTEWDWGA